MLLSWSRTSDWIHEPVQQVRACDVQRGWPVCPNKSYPYKSYPYVFFITPCVVQIPHCRTSLNSKFRGYKLLRHPCQSTFSSPHTYLPGASRLTNLLRLAHSPALHSAARPCYGCPSGPPEGQFLVVYFASRRDNIAFIGHLGHLW